jgi:hypothetical protein
MKAFVRGPISIIEINECDRTICDTICDFMDEHSDGTIYCQLFLEDLEELDDVFVRTQDCIKSEVKTQFDEEGNLI